MSDDQYSDVLMHAVGELDEAGTERPRGLHINAVILHLA